MDNAFLLCQYFYKEHIEEMVGLNIDQIILCSLYSVCRVKNVDIKFKRIMSEYKKMNNVDPVLFG